MKISYEHSDDEDNSMPDINESDLEDLLDSVNNHSHDKQSLNSNNNTGFITAKN